MLLRRYVEYLGLYLGIAFVGGAIVHMPGAPLKNGAILLIGMTMFLAASVREARSKSGGAQGLNQIGAYLALSALLSVGLGMISGSIQHFDDFPHYGSVLIPCGIGLSLFMFGWRESLLPRGMRLLALAMALLILLPLVWSGLHAFGHSAFPADHTHGVTSG